MDVKEIIIRETGSEVSVAEMSYVLEQHIKATKGVDVSINIYNRVMNSRMAISVQIAKLTAAFNASYRYFMKCN